MIGRRALAVWTLAAAAIAAAAASCDGERQAPGTVAVPGRGPGVVKSTAVARAARRAYDGAPPVIPHAPLQVTCVQCHNARGMDVPGLGFAPPTPHGSTPGMSLASRCQQCHVYKTTDALFVESDFAGAPQSLRRGERLYTGAPPVAPHGLFLREDCLACHAGPAARAELVCTHPDRARCLQCHAMPPRTGAPIEDFQR